MEECFNGISIPEGIVEPCGGEYKSTDCILSPIALTYLGLPENASQTQINIAVQAALRAREEMIDEIDGSETKISAGDNITITGDGTAASPYVVTATGGGVPFVQDNFVRVLEIPINLLSGEGTTEEQICTYILSLPENERTILETDSKWNILIISSLPKPPQVSLAIDITSDNQISLCSSINYLLDNVAYLPQGSTTINLGDSIYSDPELTQVIPDGNYECTFGRIWILNGVSTEYSCGR